MEPYPTIDIWQVDEAVIAVTLEAVQRPGRDGNEGGVFWIGPRGGTSAVRAVLIPAGEGVVEAPDFWRVIPEVYGAISAWTSARDWSLLAVCHIHGHGVSARLSGQDRNHLVRAPGVLAVVIGSAGQSRDLDEWGWYEFVAGEYEELDAPQRRRRIQLTAAGDVEVWMADRHGCRPVGAP